MRRLSAWLILLSIFLGLLTSSAPRPGDLADRVRWHTRPFEFDYASWMLAALAIKVQQGAAGLPDYVNRENGKIAVTDYVWITAQINQAEEALNRLYADPHIPDKESASEHLRTQLHDLYARQTALAPIAEAILQEQISQVVADFGLAFLGQPIPAVLYHSTSVPDGLIISPRERIEQVANISLLPDLPLERQIALEEQVSREMNVSALVVPIGGVGVYPTMVTRTTDLSWLASTVAHEWIHNYLQLRPLGMLYEQSPQLRTMNETAASIAGNEIGDEVMRRYYPRPAAGSLSNVEWGGPHPAWPGAVQNGASPFDFRAEMHRTRLTVDALLAQGKVTEAEAYMEQRRQLFVQNGYYIRKLNQAYFAFYGAYADVPGGAAGEDPVGPAVRALRAQSRSLAEFLNRIAWMTSFEDLQRAIGQ